MRDKIISISNNANKNYLAKIVKINEDDYIPHNNADKLKCVIIDYQNVITQINNPPGIYIYFPVESQLIHEICHELNLYTVSSDKENLNKDKSAVGYITHKRRVRALKLRGELSQGLILPADKVFPLFTNLDNYEDYIDEYFDTIGTTIILKKYEIVKIESLSKGKQSKQLSRLVHGQVHLHEDTDNLRKNVHKLKHDSNVTITYKIHGTSGWAANVMVKRQLKWYEKLLKKLGVNIQETEYDLVYGSRKVVKNKGFEQKTNHFYDYDIWLDIVEKYELRTKIPKGYTLYYEIVGYTKNGAYIQKDYDYGCNHGEAKLYIYRVTNTNPDGFVYDLNSLEAKEFVKHMGLDFVEILDEGRWEYLYKRYDIQDDRDIIPVLERIYNDKNCHICKNKVPEEGIVLRIENNSVFDAYKLKSARFLLKETQDLDNQEDEENV